MSGEPQLERSLLEGKERDKLQAIADRLGLKPTARTKKSELIDGILRAAGIEVPAPADAGTAKPRRAPRRRVAVVEATDEAEEGGAVALAGDDAPDSGPTPEVDATSTAEAAPAPETAPEAEATSEAEAMAEPASRPAASAEAAAAEPAPEPVPAPRPQPQPSRPSMQPPGPPGPGNHAVPPVVGPGQPAPANQPHQPAPSGPAAPGEGDVRRNRRRRGRDRERLGAGYDQQAQQADQAYSGEPLPCDGLLDLRPEGFGFLRTSGFVSGADDVYVSTSQVRKFALRAGDRIVGASRPPTTQERFGALLRIEAVGDQSPDEARRRPRFDDLTPLFPDERLTLEGSDPSDPATATGRIIDLLAPIGKGQRALIVSPPRAGTTTVLKHIARAIEANHPEVDLMVLLVDERPEEVTDMRRSVKGEVIGSTFDRPSEEHTAVAELAIEVAKRRVELGRDVVLVLDGLTRLSRAGNLSMPATGRTLPGGLDPGALQPPKRFFAAARKLEEGGSLTIIATALAETGPTTAAAVLEELEGTANAELHLDRRLAERRMFPAIDVTASSTHHDDRLLTKDELRLAWQLRRDLVAAGQDGPATKGHELLLDKLQHTRTNADLLAGLATTPA